MHISQLLEQREDVTNCLVRLEDALKDGDFNCAKIEANRFQKYVKQYDRAGDTASVDALNHLYDRIITMYKGGK